MIILHFPTTDPKNPHRETNGRLKPKLNEGLIGHRKICLHVYCIAYEKYLTWAMFTLGLYSLVVHWRLFWLFVTLHVWLGKISRRCLFESDDMCAHIRLFVLSELFPSICQHVFFAHVLSRFSGALISCLTPAAERMWMRVMLGCVRFWMRRWGGSSQTGVRVWTKSVSAVLTSRSWSAVKGRQACWTSTLTSTWSHKHTYTAPPVPVVVCMYRKTSNSSPGFYFPKPSNCTGLYLRQASIWDRPL
jgi:hypothetical protein